MDNNRNVVYSIQFWILQQTKFSQWFSKCNYFYIIKTLWNKILRSFVVMTK